MSQSVFKPIPRVVETVYGPRIHIGRISLLLMILLLALVGLFMLSLTVGSVDIPVDQILRVLTGSEAEKESWTSIILKFRLPKAITAVLVGAALSVSGLMMQTFFRNPLADPYILGVSSGASLGVGLVVLTVGTTGGTVLAGIGFIGDVSLALAASLGAGLSMLVVLFVAQRVNNGTTILILGLMFGYMASALVSLLIYFSQPQLIQAYMNWGFGTFGGVTWSHIVIFAPVVIVSLTASFGLAKSLNALLLGEVYAKSMGLDVQWVRTAIVVITGLLAGTITAFCGPVGFLGVAVPHLCRGLFRSPDHRLLIPASILLGGVVALLAAIIAEVPGSNLILPVNAVTALFGAPVVIWVILKQRKRQKPF
jgi:iron complex transport system permease protein